MPGSRAVVLGCFTAFASMFALFAATRWFGEADPVFFVLPGLGLVVAGLSDALDGLLARRFGWRSRLGGLLDPAADKVMLLACYVALAVSDGAPNWIAWLVVGRDALIVAGSQRAWPAEDAAALVRTDGRRATEIVPIQRSPLLPSA